jgi:SOS-response transcriptional repressor LexA
MAQGESKLERWQVEDADRLRALWLARKDRQPTQEAFGATYEIGNQAYISQLIRGERPLNLRAVRAFADALGRRVSDISPRLAEQIRDLGGSDDTGPYRALPLRGVPVVGTAQLGKDGYWMELEHPTGRGEGVVSYQSTDKNAYAVRVVGESMMPRIKSGEFVIVEPNHSVRPGDEVLVVTTDGQSMVKELLFERDGIVTLGSVNADYGRISLQRSQISKMHYVQGFMKSSGFLPTGSSD